LPQPPLLSEEGNIPSKNVRSIMQHVEFVNELLTQDTSE
jgi:hypothetical protein